MSREAEIAWAAGLFEGEGTWGYQPNNVRAELSMTDHDVVRRFHAVVGVGRLEPKKTYADHHLPQLMWRVTDRAGVEHVLDLFRPWLGPRRLARAETILRLQAETTAALQAERERFCKNGHERTPENTYRYWHRQHGKPARACRVCRAEQSRRQRSKRARA